MSGGAVLEHEDQLMLRTIEAAHAGIGLGPDAQVLELAGRKSSPKNGRVLGNLFGRRHVECTCVHTGSAGDGVCADKFSGLGARAKATLSALGRIGAY